MSRFLDALHSGRILLMDGAMGTELQRAGIGEGECYEAWNLTHPDKVLAIHKAYVEAGAEVLLTNTFQAFPTTLAKHNLADKVENIAERALELARTAAGTKRFVIGSMGPIPLDHLPPTSAFPILSRSDALLVETASEDLDIIPSLAWREHCANQPGIVIFGSFTFLRGQSGILCTKQGWRPQDCAGWATETELGSLGVNCGRDIGLADVVEILRQYRSVTDLPLFARPNAGTPTKVDGRWVYPVTPEQMADAVPAMIEAGATMIGGCCGTTPAHIAAMKKVIDEINRKREIKN